MSEQTILVSLNEINQVDKMLSAIKNVNDKTKAHFIGLYVIPSVQVYPVASMNAGSQVYDGFQKFFLNHADEIKEKFEKLLKDEGITGEWRQMESQSTIIAETVVEHGSMCDLVMITQSGCQDNSNIDDNFSEEVIMGCGRPVLVMPAFGDFPTFGSNILIAWNGTRESSRAVFDSMPFLQSAKKVDVSWLNPDKDTDGNMDLPGAEIATVLARHEVNVLVEAIPTAGLAAGEALLSHASDIGADMLVMGAYGHSRMREFIFGGATRTILGSMTVPVLMSH